MEHKTPINVTITTAQKTGYKHGQKGVLLCGSKDPESGRPIFFIDINTRIEVFYEGEFKVEKENVHEER